MKYTCVTSMHKGHFEYIGGVMLESWKKYWPSDAEMIVYAEGFEYQDPDSRVKFINWENYCKTLHDEFCNKTTDNSTRRFAKKGFSFLHAMETMSNEKSSSHWSRYCRHNNRICPSKKRLQRHYYRF